MTDSLASALAAFQAELPSIGKTNTARVEGKDGKAGYSYKYADLADVTTVVLPLLAKHGLSFSAKPTLDESGRFVLDYVLRHVSGGEDRGLYPLPSGTPQQVGSALTYARRYALCAVTGVAADADDDGHAAQQTRVEAKPQRHWDPIEQETLLAAWEAEIEDAKTDAEIAGIGKRLLGAKRSGEISPVTYEHLAVAGARRKAEINGEVSRAVVVETLPSL